MFSFDPSPAVPKRNIEAAGRYKWHTLSGVPAHAVTNHMQSEHFMSLSTRMVDAATGTTI